MMNESRICHEYDMLRRDATEHGLALSLGAESFILQDANGRTRTANTVAEARAFLNGWIARGRKEAGAKP